MPQKINLNVSPYFDDTNPNNNYYKILFRPGYAIQSRELTSLQSILQNQIENYAKFQFKNGELVIPGEIGLNNRLNYVKLSSVSEVAVTDNLGNIVYKQYDIKSLIGSQLRGINSGVTANVVFAEYSNANESDTLYVNYVSSGNSFDEQTFRQGETLEVVNGVNTPLLVVGTDGSVLPTTIAVTNPETNITTTISSPALGYATALKVEEGIYFVNGYFVRNEEELIIISKYYDSPSAKVGFNINEEIISPEQDASLYDNARGYSNYSAPGADRLKISLSLVVYDYDQITDKNFIQLAQIKNGVIEKKISKADYNLLEDTLARRTYDESGDYIVKDFSVDVREFHQFDDNNGIYKKDSFGFVKGYTEEVANKKLICSVGPGKAYVKGFEIVNKETKYLEIDKARDSLTKESVSIKSNNFSSIVLSNVYGSIPVSPVSGELSSYPNVYLNNVFNDGSIGLNGTTSNLRTTNNRRSKVFGLADAIKTIYVKLSEDIPLSFPNKLWFIKSRDNLTVTDVDFVDVLSYTFVNRTDIHPTDIFAEITISGNKQIIDTYFKEYDDFSVGKFTYIFDSQNDAENSSNEFGVIVDYNNTITPTIGFCKPRDFYLKDLPIGFNSSTDIVLNRGKVGVNNFPYNGIFELSYINPKLFTKIVSETIPSIGFTSGKYITGKTSGAYGVIESDFTASYSFGNTFFITKLFGEFIPGETIIDEDGNAVKIAEENTISHFVVIKRGSTYGNTENLKLIVNGEEYDYNKIEVSSFGGQIYKVSIKDRNYVKQKYSAPPSVQVSPIPSGASNECIVVPILHKNTVLNYNLQNVKSLHSQFNSYKFTSDIPVDSESNSVYKQISNFTFSGTKGTKFLECNGFGIDLSKQVIQSDVIQFSDSENNIVKNVVQYVTDPSGSIKSRIYLDYALKNDVVNSTVVSINALIKNSASSLLLPVGSKQISSIISDTTNSNIKYYIRKDFVSELSASGGIITFTAQLPYGTQRFTNFNENTFILSVLDKGSSNTVNNGDIIYINPEKHLTINNPSSSNEEVLPGSITINLPDDYFGEIPTNGNYPKLKLTATVEVSKGIPRIKTSVKNKKIIVSAFRDRIIPLRGSDYENSSGETLTYSDVYKIRYIYEGTSTNPPVIDSSGNLVSGTDVTYKYDFDNGQRDTLYDVSRIILKPGFDSSSGQLLIGFDYFEHSRGDFCVVDSYLHESGVSIDEIPTFNSNVYGIISLKDVFDFRPKIDSTSIITGYQDASIISSENTISFSGSSGVVASSIASDDNLEYSVSFNQSQFLDRIDGIYLNKQGEFLVKKGNSSLNPSKPEDINDAITLCYLHIPAFTSNSKDVRILPVDNKRYTMKDIGKLEKRIERLEYYTTLSILEQQALNMQIKDDIGFDRFKSGFIVDNFESHGIGNVKSVDYKCSIDTQQSVLRPESKESNFSLKEINTRDDQRFINGYKNSNNVITLPFKSISLLGNNNATKKINPNPFVVLQYAGDCHITPSVDQWYDDTIAPLILNTNTDHYIVFLSKLDAKESLASYYNSFIVNWIGTSSDLLGINSLAISNNEKINSEISVAKISSSSNVNPQNNEIAKGISSKTQNSLSVSSDITFFCRSIPVKFKLERLKANTKINVFIEGRNINRWVVPDSKFTGIAGNSLTVFNSDLITDYKGSLSGIILIPAGYPPLEGSSWTGDVTQVLYDTSAEKINFTSGEKTIVFTSASAYEERFSSITFAETKFYSTGSIPENPSSIVSTSPSYFKANEGVQLVNQSTSQESKPNPLIQTFKIENYNGGLFVTGLDLFFNKKDSTIPLKTYLTNVDKGKPGKYIVPGSEKTLYPETYLKVYVSGITSDSDSILVKKGELVKGKTTNASGPILKVYDKNNLLIGDENSTSFQLSRNQVYTLVLNNHNGKSFKENEILEVASIEEYKVSNNKPLINLNIAKNSGRVVDLKLNKTGVNYESALITIESPQLPGGSTATADVKVSDSKIYDVELIFGGSGYTEAPSVIIRGIGSGSSGAEIDSIIEFDSPAVIMGISSDNDDQTSLASIPTHFNFDYPVYLQNNTEYCLAIETDSNNYELWASRLGEEEIISKTTVNSQPSLGSVYRSQNIDNWTEDLLEDIKFNLYRAEFDISRPAELYLQNEYNKFEKLSANAFETSVRSRSNATSDLFKNNNYIVKVNHRDHGFEDLGKSYVFFKNCEDVGGISSTILNNNLFKISNSGLDSYNIVSSSKAGSNDLGGGANVFASFNRKYEKLYAHVNYLQFENTEIQTYVKTTNIVPVDSASNIFVSYTQSDYEKTFLNQEHYFTNQKVVCSRINEISNNINNSLNYKFILSSNISYLSPLVDLRSASVKAINNRVENSTGFENRYGKRNQILKFTSLYKLNLGITSGQDLIGEGQTINGITSNASAKVVELVSNNQILVNLISANNFVQGESLNLISSDGANINGFSSIVSQITEEDYSFSEGADLIAYYPQNTNINYSNIVNGNILQWDSKDKELVVENSYYPINGNYNSPITSGSSYTRTSTNQQQDIFRVGDVIKSNEGKYVQISEMTFSPGVDYIDELNANNSSSICKYVTKEVSLNNPGTSITVKLLCSTKDVNNIKLLYKTKESSMQTSFENTTWDYFNETGNPDTNVYPTQSNSISGLFESQDLYKEYTFTAKNLNEFDSFAVKILLKSSDPCYVPKVQDIRIVASY